MTYAFDPLKQHREMMAALDPLKQHREMMAALDPLKHYRNMTERLTRSAVRSWTRAAGTAVGDPLDDILTEFETSLRDDSAAEAEPLSGWLGQRPILAQRRLFLLAVAALWAITDSVDSFAEVSLPAHLDKVILALLAIAIYLNEKIGETPTTGS